MENNIRKIFESGKLANGKKVGSLSPSAYSGHFLYKNHPSLHEKGDSATGKNLKAITDAIKGSADLKSILPKNIPDTPLFNDSKYAGQYAPVNPLSGGTYSNLDPQTLGLTYDKFLNGLPNNSK
jgi:hypothetical protein